MIKFKLSMVFVGLLSNISYAEHCEDMEAIPISHSVGKRIIAQSKKENKYDFTYEDIEKLFEGIDERGSTTDLRYSLLNMQFISGDYKGSGTILYSDDENILLLTALHNLEISRRDGTELASTLTVLADGKDVATNIELAEMVNVTNDYVRIPGKDIVLLIAKRKHIPGYPQYVPMNKPLFNLANMEEKNQTGILFAINSTMHQYPSEANRYFKTSGQVYLDKEGNKTVGYSEIPTLGGSSGTSVVFYYNISSCKFLRWFCVPILKERIIGVHVRSGKIDKNYTNITHSTRSILVQDNIFELLSWKEASQLKPKNQNLSHILQLFLGEKDDNEEL